ncbi:DUF4443 domain-containing protein [Candidatus Bipolaricaulota bacterium]
MTEAVTALQLAHHISRSRLGRRRLALATGLSEMTVRIELERLRDQELVLIERSGVALTSAGNSHFEASLNPILGIHSVELTSLRLGPIALAAHVRVPECSAAWVLRDLAVREGASGLLLLARNGGEWRFAHDEEPLQVNNPEDAMAIEQAFPAPNSGDRLVVTFGSTLQLAGQGLWSVLAEITSLPLS